MGKKFIILVFALLVSAVAHAQLKIVGQANGVGVDTAGFPPQMREAYELMTVKCTKCHSIERVIIAVQTGICPISKEVFSKKTTEHVVARMFVKPDSNLTKSEAREIMTLLNYLLDLKTGGVAEEINGQPGNPP